MRRRSIWALAAASVMPIAPAHAGATYYVRTDGGTAQQCDGRHDAAWRAGDSHRACAWRHPFDALPPGGNARIRGGDSLVIGPGSYAMGIEAPGVANAEKCRAEWPWDCHLPPLPSGPEVGQPTRILGAGFDRGCREPPQLWGTEHASTVIDLQGSSNVEIACLEITDHSSCIEFHNGVSQLDKCERDKPPYGPWASSGISAADSANVLLRDVEIHGMAHDGIRAGRVRDWSLERVKLVANGWAGWNGQVDGASSSDSGKLLFRDVEIAWNGCAERYPGRKHFGCWGQENGGYGDGLGTAATGGEWIFDHVNVHHNAQDGIDLLHASAEATATFQNVDARANAGNQLKAGGSVAVRNSQIAGMCAALAQTNGLDDGDTCRARGNAISLRLPANGKDEIVDSNVSGEGDCLIDLECAGDGCASGAVTVSGNRLEGALRAGSASARLPCSLWVEPALGGAAIGFRHNRLRSLRNTDCPAAVECSGNDAM